MVDRRKVSPGHHEHDDPGVPLPRGADCTFTPCRADVDYVVWARRGTPAGPGLGTGAACWSRAHGRATVASAGSDLLSDPRLAGGSGPVGAGTADRRPLRVGARRCVRSQSRPSQQLLTTAPWVVPGR